MNKCLEVLYWFKKCKNEVNFKEKKEGIEGRRKEGRKCQWYVAVLFYAVIKYKKIFSEDFFIPDP